MNVFEAIEKRHCYRGEFLPGTIPNSDLQKILKAAVDAPSGRNLQTTRMVAVTEPGRVADLAEIMGKPKTATAGAMIVFAMEKGATYAVEDCSTAVENALLALTATGYASCWLDGVLRSDNRALRIADLLGIPPAFEVRIILPVGRPAEAVKGPDKKPLAERVFLDRFGAPF